MTTQDTTPVSPATTATESVTAQVIADVTSVASTVIDSTIAGAEAGAVQAVTAEVSKVITDSVSNIAASSHPANGLLDEIEAEADKLVAAAGDKLKRLIADIRSML